MADETKVESEEPKTSEIPLSGPVSGFVDTVHTPQRESVGEVGAEYLEGLEQGFIGERTDEAPDDSVYQAPTDGEAEDPKTSAATPEPERDAQPDADDVVDYESHTVEELTEMLRERDLMVSGTKAEQIQRLQDDDAGA